VQDIIAKARLLLFSPLSSTDDDEDFLGEYNGRALPVAALVASINDRSNSVAVAAKTICVGSTFPTCAEMAWTGYGRTCRETGFGQEAAVKDVTLFDLCLVGQTCWLGRSPI
jgi:hypothetical protein